MEASFFPQINHGITVEEEEVELGSVSSSSSLSEGNSANSTASSSSDFMEDATSSSSSSSSSSTIFLCPPPASNHDQLEEGSLFEMSSLMAQLPFKRGLSKHFNGKSQSFTSLANVRCLEDLAKPERPYNKRLKSSKSYGGGLDGPKPLSPRFSSKAITKKSSKGSFSSLGGRRHSFLGSRPPPIPPH